MDSKQRSWWGWLTVDVPAIQRTGIEGRHIRNAIVTDEVTAVKLTRGNTGFLCTELCTKIQNDRGQIVMLTGRRRFPSCRHPLEL